MELIIYIKMDLALSNLQRLICLKTQQQNLYFGEYSYSIEKKCTTMSVELSFNDIMFLQTGRVCIGSSVGPALANIFVGFNKKGSLSGIEKLEVYFRYINATFCLFNNEMEAALSFTSLSNV